MNFLHLLLFLLLLYLQPPFMAMADRKLIETTCKATPSYTLCLSTLLSDPKSLNGDLTDLGLIMVRATKTKAAQALSQARSLYRTRPELRHPLSECTQVYSAVVRADVPSAVAALNGGNPKFAEDGMADAAVEARACERGFGGKSPLTKMNKAVGEVADVARAIIRMLL